MIKLTWGHLNTHDFVVSLQKLYKSPIGFEAASKLKLLVKKIEEQQKKMVEPHLDILKKYGIENAEQPGTYNISEDPTTRNQYIDAMNGYNKTPFEVNVGRLNAPVVGELAKLTAHDLVALEDVLTGIPEETEIAP
jgi:hypothetical protein